jgi:beta-xylosidase
LVDNFDIGGWDPAFFADDDGRFYMYNGSSNRYPLYGIELDRKTMNPNALAKKCTYWSRGDMACNALASTWMILFSTVS